MSASRRVVGRQDLVTALLVLSCTVARAVAPTNPADAWLIKGNRAYSMGDLASARASYEHCLADAPNRLDCATNLASVLLDEGDSARAEELYRAVLQQRPADGDAAFNLAMLLHDRKTVTATREAASLYQLAVEHDDSRWDAWANLAAALAELKDAPLRAIRAYCSAILLIEQQPSEQQDPAALSRLYYGYGLQLSELSPAACRQLARDPGSLLIGDVGRDDPAQLCMENAQNALRTATTLDPTNAQAEHMLAALLSADAATAGSAGAATIDKASPAFVEALFDDFAATFDERLVGQLHYKVPELVGAAASALGADRGGFLHTLDAGAGTGLAGPHLRGLTRNLLVAVDISSEMLARAAQLPPTVDGTPIYDGLHALDLLTMDAQQLLGEAAADGFDLVAAADVLVYFGKLDQLLNHFARLSAPGAGLIFSCERVEALEADAGWKILPSGRFAHSKAYVLDTAAAAGYQLRAYEQIVPRMEGEVPVKGHLFTFVLE